MSEPISGNHNDLYYDIEVQFEMVTATLEEANISVEGLFLNADAGFNSKKFRETCDKKDINTNVRFNKRNGNTEGREEYFDQDLYNQRNTVERTNAWMDSFRSLLNRFDTTVESWIVFNFICYSSKKKSKKEKLKKFKRVRYVNFLTLICCKYKIIERNLLGIFREIESK